jgi:hypothetical protein
MIFLLGDRNNLTRFRCPRALSGNSLQHLTITVGAERQLEVPLLVASRYPELCIDSSHDLPTSRAVKSLLGRDGKRI